jgi:GH18 family chitinase
MITAYLSEWTLAQMDDDTIAIDLTDIDFTKITHVFVPQLQPTSASNPVLTSGWGIAQYASWIQAIKDEITSQGASTKVLVSIYDSGGGKLAGIVANAGYRASFVSNVHTFIDNNGCDGADLDWEEIASYKTGGQDTLITDLYNAMHAHGHLITIAGAPEQTNITATLDSKMDIINVMSYDIANLVHSTYAQAVASVNTWVDAGFTKSKVVMGLPAYGKDNNGIVALWSDIVAILAPTDDEVSEVLASITTPWNGLTTVDGGTIWYGGIDLCKQKATFILNNSFGGCMIFDLGEDEWLDPSKGITGPVYTILAGTPGNVPTVIDRQVGASADDGYVLVGDDDIDIISADVYTGNTYTQEHAFYRFTNITIPRYATIVSAYFTLMEYSSGGTPLTSIYAIKENNPTAPTTCADYLGRTLTTAFVDWDTDPGEDNNWNNSADISAVIQEIVDAYDLSADPIVIMHKDRSSGAGNYRKSEAWDNEVTWAAKLHIEYIIGWGHEVMGVASPAEVMGVTLASIAEVMGVAA